MGKILEQFYILGYPPIHREGIHFWQLCRTKRHLEVEVRMRVRG